MKEDQLITVEEITVGDRVIELPGTPSQKCGTVIGFGAVAGKDTLFPVIHWDIGFKSFSSPEYGLKKLEDEQQLSFF